MDVKFPCSGCGCCCRRVDQVIANINVLDDYNKELLRFPYNHNNGVCENLMEDNKCAVYEDRPLICNFDKFVREYEFERVDFYNLIITSCNKMMDEDNIDSKFKINKL